MSLNDTYRVLVDHTPGDDPDWDYHEWWMPGEVVRRDNLGRRQGVHGGNHRRWHVVRCNNGECPAEAIVHEAAIIDLLPAAVTR